jgi:hypothetical protein
LRIKSQPVRASGSSPNKDSAVDSERVLLSAIETLASLRSERVNWALTRAERAAMVDARALGREMDRLLETWRCEICVNGAIEDKAQEVVELTLN